MKISLLLGIFYFMLPLAWGAEDLFLSKTTQCQAQSSSSRKEVCLNIGGGNDTIGKYLGDHKLVTYYYNGGKPKVYTTYKKISNTNAAFAYSKQMGHYRELGFRLLVKKGLKHNLKFGFACILQCIEEKTETTIVVQNQIRSKANIYSLKKERNPHIVSVNGIDPIPNNAWGKIEVRIENPKTAMLATLCISRDVSFSSCPQENRRHNFQGKFAVAHLHHSAFVKKGEVCSYLSSSLDVLKLPGSAKIAKAYISWSATGTPASATTSILLNKQKVSTTWTSERIGYLAHVDVTNIVRKFGNGGYVVENIENNNDITCIDGYAAWSLVVLYELNTLPVSNINIWAIGFKFQFDITCVNPSLAKKTKLLMAVTETDLLNGDDLYINGKKAIENVFDLRHGQAFDVVTKDITKYILPTDSKITIRHTLDNENVVYMMVVTTETV